MFLLIFVLVPIFQMWSEELPVGGRGEFGISADGLAGIEPVVEVMVAEKKLVGANVLVMRRGHIQFKGGGSGLVSTTTDYAKFLQMIADGGEFQGKRYLQEDTVDLRNGRKIKLRSLNFYPDVVVSLSS